MCKARFVIQSCSFSLFVAMRSLCPAGTYQNSSGATSCDHCDLTHDSLPGATSCTPAHLTLTRPSSLIASLQLALIVMAGAWDLWIMLAVIVRHRHHYVIRASSFAFSSLMMVSGRVRLSIFDMSFACVHRAGLAPGSG